MNVLHAVLNVVLRIWRSGRNGKIALGCSGLLGLCMACSLLSVITSPATSTHATATAMAKVAIPATVESPRLPVATATLALPVATQTLLPATAFPTLAATETRAPTREPTTVKTQIPPTPAKAAITPSPTAAMIEGPNVVITRLDVGAERVTLKNTGNTPQDMTGWSLLSIEGNQRYAFPAGFVLRPGESVVLVSGMDSVAAGELLWSTRNIHNDKGDACELYDAQGQMVSKR